MNNLQTLLKKYKVVIPPIQRDYAQGRDTGKIPIIRERFIDSLFKVLSNDDLPSLELDFIYGYIELDNVEGSDINIFKPLDGQQRLTTLFLIHWFVLNKECKTDVESKKQLLQNFTYATRQTSRNFCHKLIDFEVDWSSNKKVDEQIVNQPWFYSNWTNDPTIQSMLVVLRAIQDKFIGLENTWAKLTDPNPRISFRLLSMNDLGLPDDLYIKMNARGKPLTNFEHFKSSFSEILDDEDAKIFNEKVDSQWSDLFWDIFKERDDEDIARLVDSGFLSFFWFITDLLVKQQNITVSGGFWLDKISIVYNNKENVKFLFDCFDLFYGISQQNNSPFNEIFYIADTDFSISKAKLFFKNAKVNLFHRCVESYLHGNFVIREQLLLYAFIKIKLDNVVISDSFYRLTRNLLENASDKQIRNENLINLYKAIDALMDGERKPENLPFTQRQLMEEAKKEELLTTSPSLTEIIYRLEDHNLLRGTIGVFTLDINISNIGNTFLSVFSTQCNYFEISRAMLTLGLYPQNYGGGRLRFGNKNYTTWQEILTQSENRTGFENTKGILKDYLILKENNSDVSDLSIVSSYLNDNNTLKDLRYYIIKYNSFIQWINHQTEGYYYWQNYNTDPYNCVMLFRTNFRGRSWSPFLLEISQQIKNCSIENYSSTLQYTNDNLILIISHSNNGFKFSAPAEDSFSVKYLNKLIEIEELNTEGYLLIEQDNNGIDKIDRIEYCINFLNRL